MTGKPDRGQMNALFDPLLFGAALFRARTANRAHILSLRSIAESLGISTATLSRVENGKAPSVENYLRIKLFIEMEGGA